MLSLAGGVRGAASNTKDHRNDDDNEELYFPICDTNKDILLPVTKENANVPLHSRFDRFRGDFGVKIFFRKRVFVRRIEVGKERAQYFKSLRF